MDIVPHPATRWHWIAKALAMGTVLSCNTASAASVLTETPLGQYYVPPAKSLEIIADQRYTYDTNPLKLARKTDSLQGSESVVHLLLNSRTPNSLLRSDSSVSYNVYDNSAFDTTNFSEQLIFNHNTAQWRTSTIAKYDYDTTRTSEITSFGISTPAVRHKQYQLTPEISYVASEDNTYLVHGNWSKSSYDIASFVGYTMYEVTPSWQHRIDSIHSALLNVTYNKFQTDSGTPLTTTTYGPSFGFINEWSPSLRSRFTAGFEKSEKENQSTNVTTKQNNYVYSGSLTYATDQHNLDFLASRAQRPTGNGTSGLYTTLRLAENYKLSSRISLDGMMRYRDARYIGNPGLNLSKDYTGGTGLRYKLLDQLDVSCNYQYLRQELTNNGLVRSHMVMVGFNLHPFAWGL